MAVTQDPPRRLSTGLMKVCRQVALFGGRPSGSRRASKVCELLQRGTDILFLPFYGTTLFVALGSWDSEKGPQQVQPYVP